MNTYDAPSFAQARVQQVGPDKYEAVHGGDNDLFVSFEMHAVHLTHKSELEGRPLYEEREFIRIRFPGDKTREVFREVKRTDDAQSPSDMSRFPRQWSAFKAQHAPALQGTPLEQWPPINRAQVAELKGLSIHTVEALAGVPDTTLHNLGMGGRELRDRAKAWLDSAKGGAGISELLARMAALEADNQALRARVEAAPSLPVDASTGEPREANDHKFIRKPAARKAS
jgi:hypothetical protein